jgi:ribosome maturation factor RimP
LAPQAGLQSNFRNGIMQIEERIETLIEPVLADMGYALVRVQLTDAPNSVLQVMAERDDQKGMTVDDCARISREISTILDVEDPINLAYALEVSSPGIDRPLVTLADFERYAGFDVRIDLKKDVAGQRRFRGRLRSVSGEMIELQTKDRNLQLPFPGIRRAKLILTDELLAAAAAKPEE